MVYELAQCCAVVDREYAVTLHTILSEPTSVQCGGLCVCGGGGGGGGGHICHRLNCDDCLGGVMGSVLMCILMWISISNIIFYTTCFKGSITKGDLAMEYFGYNGILCRLKWMCG